MKKNQFSFLKKILFGVYFFCLLSCQNGKLGDFKSPLDSVSFFLNKDSTNVSLLNKRSKIYMQEGRLVLAKNDIDNAYAIFKNDTEILLNRGDIYFLLNKTRVSKDSWERCLKLDPNNLECREKLINLLCTVKDPNCKSMIDTLVLINNGLIANTFIVYLKELYEYELAIDLLNNILKESPQHKESLMMLSILYSDTSSINDNFNSQLAEKYFNSIIELYPNEPKVYYNFGKYKQNIYQYKDALELYYKGLNLTEVPEQIYYNMGFCAMQIGEYVKAIDYFSNAIKIDQSFLLAYHARAYLYNLTENHEKAKADWKNCLMLNPAYIPALEALSK